MAGAFYRLVHLPVVEGKVVDDDVDEVANTRNEDVGIDE